MDITKEQWEKLNIKGSYMMEPIKNFPNLCHKLYLSEAANELLNILESDDTIECYAQISGIPEQLKSNAIDPNIIQLYDSLECLNKYSHKNIHNFLLKVDARDVKFIIEEIQNIEGCKTNHYIITLQLIFMCGEKYHNVHLHIIKE